MLKEVAICPSELMPQIQMLTQHFMPNPALPFLQAMKAPPGWIDFNIAPTKAVILNETEGRFVKVFGSGLVDYAKSMTDALVEMAEEGIRVLTPTALCNSIVYFPAGNVLGEQEFSSAFTTEQMRKVVVIAGKHNMELVLGSFTVPQVEIDGVVYIADIFNDDPQLLMGKLQR